MSEFINYRDASRRPWGVTQEGDVLARDQIQLGAILRIADATEEMAKDRQRMERDLAYYQKRCDEQNGRIDRLLRSNAALRGHLKRMKAKEAHHAAE